MVEGSGIALSGCTFTEPLTCSARSSITCNSFSQQVSSPIFSKIELTYANEVPACDHAVIGSFLFTGAIRYIIIANYFSKAFKLRFIENPLAWAKHVILASNCAGREKS